jgi:hypothetical protein
MPKNKKNNTQYKPRKKPVQKEAEYQEVVRFTAISRVFREKEFGYNSDGDFAKKYKVNPSTLSAWKKDNNFWNEVKNLTKTWGKDRTPDVILALYKKIIKDGGAAEVKLWLQYVDGWDEKSDVNVHYTLLKEIQDTNRSIFKMAEEEDDKRKEDERKK